MNSLSLPAACLCLATGALLGGVFLALKLGRILLGGGRVFIFVSDLLLGPLCAVTAFTVALAVDKGRLRLFQVILQGLGAWGTVCALDPLISGTAMGIKKLAVRLRRFFRRWVFHPVGAWGKRWFVCLLGWMRKRIPAKKPKKKRHTRKKRRGRSGSVSPSSHPVSSRGGSSTPRKTVRAKRKGRKLSTPGRKSSR